jgi:hypothetical protein
MATQDLIAPSSPDQPADAAGSAGASPSQAGAAPSPLASGNRLVPFLDIALAAALVVLAFLLASFPARNSDLWQHLAAGRLLASGAYHFGVDPFASTTEGVYWANHAWLFDLSAYLLYQAAGGAGLVVVKALLVLALAWLMLRIRREGAAWVPPACTALALLALGPRLLLQPACVSFVLLGLTLFLLWRGDFRGWRGLLVPLTCALWVNLDGWFLLGPLLVALFWLGGLLPSRSAGPRVPGWLVLASLAACLCSPHHWHAFVLPAELSPTSGVIELRQDPRFRPLFASPWEPGPLLSLGTSVNLMAWAYFALVALGLFSLVLARKELPPWRLLVWLAFGLLGAWQARLVPFFAVVAGPITALNLQDALARRASSPGQRRSVVAGRLALLSALLALVVLAWPGWLQGFGRSDRHVGWGVEANPSLVRSARTLESWRQSGRLAPDERVLALHPDVASYWAWFCPEEKGFLDHRFLLFGPVASVYEDMSRAFFPDRESRPSGPAWRQALQSQGIRHVVLYDPDRARQGAALRRLAEGTEWELCSVDGQALLVRWNDPEGGKQQGANAPRSPGCLDPKRVAFGAGGKEQEQLPSAPALSPGQPPAEPGGWSAFREAPRPPAWESDAARVYLGLFNAGALSRQESKRNRPSPALPLLAIRAARRALAANPEDAGAWLVLGQAYLTLGALTGEADLGGSHAPLARLRHVQAVTALHYALELQPDLEPAHAALADLYARRDYLDAALPHRLAQLRLARRGPVSGEGSKDHARRLAQLEKAAEGLEKAVQDRRHQFTVQTSLPDAGTNPRAQALLAERLGLPGKALEVLGRHRVEEFGGDGARLELELLLLLGRAREARDKLNDDQMLLHRDKLGFFDRQVLDPAGRVHIYRLPAYDWLCLWEAAAHGDYDRAAGLLAAVGEHFRKEEERQNPSLLRARLALALGAEVLANCPPPSLVQRYGVMAERRRLTDLYSRTALLASERADLEVVAGLLALERGLPEQAMDRLRRALDLAPGFVARPLAQTYLRLEAGRR